MLPARAAAPSAVCQPAMQCPWPWLELAFDLLYMMRDTAATNSTIIASCYTALEPSTHVE